MICEVGVSLVLCYDMSCRSKSCFILLYCTSIVLFYVTICQVGVSLVLYYDMWGTSKSCVIL